MRNDKPIGTIASYEKKAQHQNPDQDALYIDSFYIDEENRGQGLGSLILADISVRVPDRAVELNCYYENRAAHLYERLGGKSILTKYYYPRPIPVKID